MLKTNVFAEIRESCRFVQEKAQHVRIDMEAVERVGATLDEEKVREFAHAPGFPLKFEKLSDEVNMYCVLNLLNIGSGFRKELHGRKGQDRGAYETILFGVLSAYLQGAKLDAAWLCGLDKMHVEQLFQIPHDEEAPTRIAAVYQSRPSSLAPLVQHIIALCNQAGGVLSGRRYNTLGEWVLAEARGECEPIVRQLCVLFEGFADRAQYAGRTVWLCKKAQVLAADLLYALGPRDERFNFRDAGQLTACADNVVPAVLRQLGVLRVSDALAADIEHGVSITGDREVELRALAVVAVDELARVAATHGKALRPIDISYALWRMGKEPEFRTAPRHANKETIFY